MIDSGLLDSFIAWANGAAACFRGSKITPVLDICPPTSNSAANLHIDGDAVVARITCWADGSYHAEALEAATGHCIFARHGGLTKGTVLNAEFEVFFDFVRRMSA